MGQPRGNVGCSNDKKPIRSLVSTCEAWHSKAPHGQGAVFYPATQPLFKKLKQLSQRSSVSRGQAFEDWLTAMVCALAAETKEDEYIAMIERHKSGKPGQRGVDLMPQMFGELANAMSESDADILGDLFQGSITYGEAGQYLSPDATPVEMKLPTIIEVPQWLARLEPKLAALDHDKPTAAEERPEPERPGPEAPPPKQRELF